MRATDPLKHAVRLFPGRTAVVCGEESLTWAQVGERARRFAGGLKRLGVERGDRVAILMLNCHRYVDAYLGTIWAGAVIVPLNYRLAAVELAYQLRRAGVEVLVVSEACRELYEQLASEPHPVRCVIYAGEAPAPSGALSFESFVGESGPIDDLSGEDQEVCLIAYTGATTGLPKGVMVSHQYLAGNGLRMIGHAFEYADGEVYLCAAPMFHIGQTLFLWATTYVGGTLVVVERYAPEEIFRLIEKHRVSQMWVAAPSMVTMLLRDAALARHDLGSLRQIVFGGSPEVPQMLAQAHEKLPWVRFTENYSSTEAPWVATFPGKERLLDKGGTDARARELLAAAGRQVRGLQFRVVQENGSEASPGEVGEIVVRGHDFIMNGYWADEEQTAATLRDGWLWTGDLGRVDAEGYVTISGRKKEMIRSGGENVYAAEVERVLQNHPAVLEAAVIGLPDERWGERVHACVVVRPGMSVGVAELEAHCRRSLGGYKVPRSFDFLAALPKTEIGKVAKSRLPALCAAASSGPRRE